MEAPHLLIKHLAWQVGAWGGALREEEAPRTDWPSSLTLSFPQTELEGFRGPWKKRGGVGGWQKRPWTQKPEAERKDVMTASVGEGAPGQMTSQAQDPKAPMASREYPPPPRAPWTQGPLFYLLVSGLELGAPGRKECLSLHRL